VLPELDGKTSKMYRGGKVWDSSSAAVAIIDGHGIVPGLE
jgi:hypothetical protein